MGPTLPRAGAASEGAGGGPARRVVRGRHIHRRWGRQVQVTWAHAQVDGEAAPLPSQAQEDAIQGRHTPTAGSWPPWRRQSQPGRCNVATQQAGFASCVATGPGSDAPSGCLPTSDSAFSSSSSSWYASVAKLRPWACSLRHSSMTSCATAACSAVWKVPAVRCNFYSIQVVGVYRACAVHHAQQP